MVASAQQQMLHIFSYLFFCLLQPILTHPASPSQVITRAMLHTLTVVRSSASQGGDSVNPPGPSQPTGLKTAPEMSRNMYEMRGIYRERKGRREACTGEGRSSADILSCKHQEIIRILYMYTGCRLLSLYPDQQ